MKYEVRFCGILPVEILAREKSENNSTSTKILDQIAVYKDLFPERCPDQIKESLDRG